MKFLKKNFVTVLLGIFILGYIAYFSYFTILRYHTIYASYFDLGIMNQTVYNTYQGLKTGDVSRILEQTDPFGPAQIKRMAIHNDILLALFAPFYFLFAGPETLLLIQAIVIGLGALAVFLITKEIIKHDKGEYIALTVSLCYLFFPALERANIYEFHAVTLATSLLLFMFYFWLKKKYLISIIFFIFSILSKENVALTTGFFALYAFFSGIDLRQIKGSLQNKVVGIVKKAWSNRDNVRYALTIFGVSVVWFLISVFVIIPFFRGGRHFALGYYDDGVADLENVIHVDSARYLLYLLGPLGLTSLLSPLTLLISLPELLINLASSNWNMRNIIYHYSSVITPWVFVSAIFSQKKLLGFFSNHKKALYILISYLLVCTVIFAYWLGPLPFAKDPQIHPFKYKRGEQADIDAWAQRLRDDSLKISASSQIAPVFTSRRYFYTFSKYYYLADYVVLRLPEVYNYPEKDQLIPVYETLQKDTRFRKIYSQNNVEVYKKI